MPPGKKKQKKKKRHLAAAAAVAELIFLPSECLSQSHQAGKLLMKDPGWSGYYICATL